MTFKDYFSRQAVFYARFRPQYPDDLFEYLASVSPGKHLAWDCAAGSGQAAAGLSRYFEKVIATDASSRQIGGAKKTPDVEFRLARAEDSGLLSRSVDLITVAQALHWFDLDGFFGEAERVLKPGGILAAWTYAFMTISPEVDAVLERFLRDVVGAYWPPERVMVDERYARIHFPFEPLGTPEFQMNSRWDFEHLCGYLKSWSAVQRFEEANGSDPVALIRDDLNRAWGKVSCKKEVTWPLTVKIRKKGGIK